MWKMKAYLSHVWKISGLIAVLLISKRIKCVIFNLAGMSLVLFLFLQIEIYWLNISPKKIWFHVNIENINKYI